MNSLLGYAYNPPSLIKKVFKDFQWDSIEKKILLTFDDGPNPKSTKIILNTLDKYSIKQGFANGELQVRGPIWKALSFADIFQKGRAYYPDVLKDQGFG